MSHRTRLAHLSDIHLPSSLPRGSQWLSKCGLSALSWLAGKRKKHLSSITDILQQDLIDSAPDLIAVGGDVVNFGTSQEFQASQPWLQKLGTTDKVVTVPGNHEALTRGWKKRISLWGDYASLHEEQMPVLRKEGVIGLIAVSTAVATPPFMASGKVGAQHIKAMGDLIAEAHSQNLCPVVLMHHPPTDITSRRKGLSDHKAVCQELSQQGAALVLHGHTHHAELSWINTPLNAIPVLGIPSFSLSRHDGRYSGAWRMIEVHKEKSDWIISVTERTLDEEDNLQSLTPLRFSQPIKK
ncbi:MAG: metallophosphoesterase [Hyphomicrobiales bacterium]